MIRGMIFSRWYLSVIFIPFLPRCASSGSASSSEEAIDFGDANTKIDCLKHIPFACDLCDIQRVLVDCRRICLIFCRRSELLRKTTTTTTVQPPTRNTKDRNRDKQRQEQNNLAGPNRKFLQCCRKNKKIPKTCHYLCNFAQFNKENIVLAYLLKKCPISAGIPVLNCAESYADHTDCCRENRIHLVHDGQCMSFCHSAAGKASMRNAYFCLETLKDSKSCFIEHMNAGQRRSQQESTTFQAAGIAALVGNFLD